MEGENLVSPCPDPTTTFLIQGMTQFRNPIICIAIMVEQCMVTSWQYIESLGQQVGLKLLFLKLASSLAPSLALWEDNEEWIRLEDLDNPPNETMSDTQNRRQGHLALAWLAVDDPLCDEVDHPDAQDGCRWL
ncbi:hypothetical protein Scep_026129 [Stephania cephalantha]|uniref:Uncharacterized protein n=1 Tax=Stephania cephalantha TaxID=152367 RepID=A0AAP0EJJ0_9MAGN